MTCSAARNGASSSTYITASEKNDTTSDSAPTTGLRCNTTTSAKITATAAKKKKITYSSIGRRRKCKMQNAECRNNFAFCILHSAFHIHPFTMKNATSTIFTTASGKNTFQPRRMRMSYFNRGIVQRTHTNTKSSTDTLIVNESADRRKPMNVGGS